MYGLLINGCKQAKYIPYAGSILGFLMRNNAGNILICCENITKALVKTKTSSLFNLLQSKWGKRKCSLGRLQRRKTWTRRLQDDQPAAEDEREEESLTRKNTTASIQEKKRISAIHLEFN